MKLIHCSDLHLDSSMGTNFPPKKSIQRKHEIERTFERMVQYARQNNVSVIMIAGDLFDTSSVTTITVDFIMDLIRQNKNIDFLYLRGNHDKNPLLLATHALPGNLKTFGESWITYSYPEVDITGIEFTENNFEALYNSLSLDFGRANIVLLHGAVGTSPSQDTICLPKLRQKGIDYLALGHLHSYRSELLDGRGCWCYSGCLEGRGFDECGDKGFVLLETDGNSVRQTFIPFAMRTLHEVETDISGLEKFSQIRAVVSASISSVPVDSILKIILKGNVSVNSQIDTNFLENCFADDYFYVTVKDETGLSAVSSDYSGDISLKGVFTRSVLNDSSLSDDEKKKVIQAGLHALAGEEIAL